MFGDRNAKNDIEAEYRFYKKRDYTTIPQSQWLFEIFKESMNSRINASGILCIIFVTISAVFYELVISDTTLILPVLNQIY